jgi:hypothetical protein
MQAWLTTTLLDLMGLMDPMEALMEPKWYQVVIEVMKASILNSRLNLDLN